MVSRKKRKAGAAEGAGGKKAKPAKKEETEEEKQLKVSADFLSCTIRLRLDHSVVSASRVHILISVSAFDAVSELCRRSTLSWSRVMMVCIWTMSI